MKMTAAGQDRRTGLLGALARAILPWCLVVVIAHPLLMLRWQVTEPVRPLLRLQFILGDLALVLPFLMFAGGVTLRNRLGYSGRAVRSAIVLGATASILVYSLDAWTLPLVEHRDLVNLGPETADVRQFGADTPVGLLRNLRFVEANPPDEYSLSVEHRGQHPPDMLRWMLHLPAAVAVLALVNVFLGFLSAELTFDLRRGRRRNALLAIGVLGAVAFLVIMALTAIPRFTPPTMKFPTDVYLPSGILAAWIPLALPLAQCVLLACLVRRRRY